MRNLRLTLFSVPATLLIAGGILSADTVTDTSLNVTYTATSTFTPVTDNTYDVFLTIDATGFSAGTGFLDAVSLAFKTGSDVATSVSLVQAPGGTVAWNSEQVGGLDSSGCNGNGGASGAVCFQNAGSAGTSVPASGNYTFEFAVTLPNSDALTAASDIKAAYNTLQNNQGKNLGLTSMGITIQPSTTSSVPEPASFLLLGSGLLGVALLRKRPGKRTTSVH